MSSWRLFPASCTAFLFVCRQLLKQIAPSSRWKERAETCLHDAQAKGICLAKNGAPRAQGIPPGVGVATIFCMVPEQLKLNQTMLVCKRQSCSFILLVSRFWHEIGFQKNGKILFGLVFVFEQPLQTNRIDRNDLDIRIIYTNEVLHPTPPILYLFYRQPIRFTIVIPI